GCGGWARCDLLRATARRPAPPARGRVCGLSGRAGARRGHRAGALSRAAQRRGRAGALRGRSDRPRRGGLRDRQPRQGSRRERGAERERRTRLRRGRGPAAHRSAGMSVTAARGFTASGVAARISKLGPDLALVAGNGGCGGGAVFPANRGQAAPVLVSTEHLERAQPQAVVINAGNANAATGAQGVSDARATADRTAHLLGLGGEEVLVLSTGVIGVPLPMQRLLPGIDEAVSALSP